jgi:transcription elongation factor S-II
MPILSTVLLTIKGEARKANLQLTPNGDLNIDIIQKYFKKKEEPECICHWENDSKIIFVFGYKKGKKGTENKTELPDPYSELTLFGDAIIIVSMSNKWENPVPYTVDQWTTFINGIGNSNNEEDDEDGEENEYEDEEEDEEESEEDSVKDEYDDESEKNSIVEESEDEPEEAPLPVKRKRVPTIKIDTSGLKEEIQINSEPELNQLRMACINNMKFLELQFSKENIRLLEKGIFEAAFNHAAKNFIPRSWKSPVFNEVYRQKVRSVLCNIHPASPVKNPRLLNRILEGEFKLEEIPMMTSYEMYPEKWFELKDKLLQREQKILEGNKSRATDQFKCRRCQKRECTYYELQTRSADEPMTIFITCLNCGKEWRNGG